MNVPLWQPGAEARLHRIVGAAPGGGAPPPIVGAGPGRGRPTGPAAAGSRGEGASGLPAQLAAGAAGAAAGAAAAAARRPRPRTQRRRAGAIAAAATAAAATKEVEVGKRVRVNANGLAFYHVPKHKGVAFDPHGLFGEVIDVIEGEELTPNRPVLVKLILPQANSAAASPKPRSFTAHFEAEELCVCADPSGAGSEELPVEQDDRWKINLLYDGHCPSCMKQVEFLQKRMDENPEYAGVVRLTDLTDPGYDAGKCGGVDFEDGMRHIHAVTRDGEVIHGVNVFRRVYSIVGMEWVHTVTSLPLVGGFCDWAYDLWAEYRLQLTGREDAVEKIRKHRERIQELSVAECEKECEIDWDNA